MMHAVHADTQEHFSNDDENVTVLESVDIKVRLWGLLSHVSVEQVYANPGDENIEAVYTFPLPRDAVLMDLSLELNGEILKAEVYEKSEAQDQYEDAIEDGDSAILLEQLGPGLYAVNAGNVLPGERAVVRFRYAQLHRWQGNDLRIHIPTTLAPWYGDPGLEPHLAPRHTLSASCEFSVNFQIEGPLARAEFDCPSHEVKEISRDDEARKLSLPKGRAVMDRDVVLVLTKPSGFVPCGIWACDLIGEEAHEAGDKISSKISSGVTQENHAALISFNPAVRIIGSRRCVVLVVDCSGSMAGDSIAQAKEALHHILMSLERHDFFNLIVFGSAPDSLFKKPVAASRWNISRAIRFVKKLDANRGGTEIAKALKMTYGFPPIKGHPADILLITDGEVWDEGGDIIEEARRSGHRIFTVGVGSAVSESFVRNLAEETSGACELVSPNENMASRIVRHFQRINQPDFKSIKIEWPEGLVRQYPSRIENTYLGDTLHVWGWFENPPSGTVKLAMEFEDGQTVSQEVSVWMRQEDTKDGFDDLPRMAIYSRLAELDSDETLQMAKRYKLVTEQTSYVLVLEREEDQKADGHPVLRTVSHTLPAGYGGIGTVLDSTAVMPSYGSPMYCRELPEPSRPETMTRSDGFRNLVATINSLDWHEPWHNLLPETISDLEEFGLAPQSAEQLIDLADHTGSERDLVIAFLALLSLGYREKKFDSHVKKAIWDAYQRTDLPATVTASIATIIDGSLKPST